MANRPLGISVTCRKRWNWRLAVFWAKVKCCFDNSDEAVHNEAIRVMERAMDIRINGERVSLKERSRG